VQEESQRAGRLLPVAGGYVEVAFGEAGSGFQSMQTDCKGIDGYQRRTETQAPGYSP
jgi:hypothetical protein